MDLNDIAFFVQVVRAGSFAEAGRRLGVPQSTGSRRLQELERSLGVRLLQRSTRRLALTDAGQAFFTECVDQVDAIHQAAQNLADRGKTPTGRVRVAASVDFLDWFPLGLIAEFMAKHPGIRVEFVLSDARADLLADGIDVAFRAGKMVEPTLVAKEIGEVKWCMVASPDYLSRHGIPATPDDLARHDCITRPALAGSPVVWQLNGPSGQVDVSVTGRFQVNTQRAQIAAAQAGLGIALTPSLTTLEHIAQATLINVLPDYYYECGVHVVYPSRRHIPRAVSIFTEFASTVLFERGMISPPRRRTSRER